MKSALLYWMLAAGSSGATAWDAESTVRTLQRCADCVEGNPLLRGFAHQRGALHGVTQGLNSGGLVLAWKWKKDGNKWWWTIPVATIGLHSALAVRNQHNAR